MTDPMTRVEVLAAKARADKATEGPWCEERTTKVGRTFLYSKYPFEIPDDLMSLDQNFLNYARTDVPRLAATLLDVVQVLSWEVAAHPRHCNCHSCKWLRKFEGGE